MYRSRNSGQSMKKYLCGVSFQHELNECTDIHFYDTLEELKEKGKCWEECGVVEIEFDEVPEKYTSKKWVIAQNLFGKGIGVKLDKGKDEE